MTPSSTVRHAVRFTRAFINGAWAPLATASTPIIDPATESHLTSVAACASSDVDAAVAAARVALVRGPWGLAWSGPQRRQLLHDVADRLDQGRSELAWLECLGGKPIRQAAEDVDASIECLRHFAGYADQLHGKHFASNTHPKLDSYTIRSPIGVCGLITSFNYPLLLTVWKVAPALAAGNTVVVKPGVQTPLSTLFLAHAFESTNAPPGVFNVVLGDASIGAHLASHPDINMVSFTGSTQAGRRVAAASAHAGPRPCTLELGGKNTIIIDSYISDHLDVVADAVVTAAFANMGQNCCAASKLLVHERVYDEIVCRVVDRVGRLVMGDPKLRETDIGPLVNRAQMERVLNVIALAEPTHMRDASSSSSSTSVHGRVVIGGHRVGNRGFFVTPTVITGVDDASPLAREEIFGPVLAVLKPFKTIEEAVYRANDTVYGLAAGIYTTNLATAQYATQHLQAGMVWLNCYNESPPHLPFGGTKLSGHGKDLGLEAVESFTTIKSVLSARL